MTKTKNGRIRVIKPTNPTTMILTKEPMTYKHQIQKNEIVTKLRIIRTVKLDKVSHIHTAEKFQMHRNSVGNIISAFEKQLSTEAQNELLSNKSMSQSEIEAKMSPIRNQSSAPHTNKRSANKEQEALIKSYFNKRNMKAGSKRMFLTVKRMRVSMGTEDDEAKVEQEILKNLSYSQIRGIYKRNKFKIQKVRAYNGSRTPLYDYKALSCFERLHYDTKDILDKKALPEDIYKKFKLCKNLPIIEWNIIDVKSRFRFIAYSHARTSEFGLHFLILVLQYIRAMNIPIEQRITIGTDNGSEFYSGSKRKEIEWNKLLNILNAEIYSYNPGFDVRKNLIERSHRTDDEDFLVPRGRFIKGKKSFLIEAEGYAQYFNSMRPHQGIEMHDMTPVEKLASCGIYNAKRFLEFPTMILEDHIGAIKKTTEIIRLSSYLNEYKQKHKSLVFDQKFICNLKANFKNFEQNAQKVLTYYLTLDMVKNACEI